MATLSEPVPLEMERISLHRHGKDAENVLVDFSRLPRSSGDGMEFSSSNSSNDSFSEDSEESDLTQKANNILLSSTVKRNNAGKKIVNGSAQITTGMLVNSSGTKYRDENEIFTMKEMGTSTGHPNLVEFPQLQIS